MPPRRTSQAVKKDTEAAEAKNEGGATRRSGRAVSKPETSTRVASRSRRSSTAAQTAASVADSKTPKGRSSVSSHRDSTSPSDLTPRAKAARRSTGRINYKESDGEEENAAPKVDENFHSGDELDESESDENSKPKGKGKASRSPAKGRGAAKAKATPRSRRGRPSKKKRGGSDEDEEEKETVEISDDSGEPEEIAPKKTKAVKEKEPPKPSRSRRQRSEVTEIKLDDDKPKSSRRSSRGASNKEEAPKKRPARNVQAKRYAEDDDVEEIDDTKETEEVDEGARKRKRGSSPEEASKRLKGDEESGGVKADADEMVEEKETDEKPVEAMEVDEPEIPKEPSETKTEDLVGSGTDKADAALKEVIEDKEMQEESSVPQEEKIDEVSKPESVKSSEIIDESKNSSISEPEPKAEDPKISAAKPEESKLEKVVEKKVEKPKESTPEKPKILPPAEDKPASENVTAPVVPEKPVEIVSKVESAPVPPTEQVDASNCDSPSSDESKPLTIDENQTSSSPTAAAVPQPKETNQDAVLNGSEKTGAATNAAHGIQIAPSSKSEHIEKSTPTENGAHDDDVQHTNSTSPADQYYSLPGRKYVCNSKLSDSVRQSVKDKTFGFVSYNLGVTSSDAYLQKEKLLNELNSLDARIICLQQVAKPFFTAVLEPSLDALGFKSIFCQPDDSLKGVATFYKTSLFRPTKKTEISLKKLVEKELESSSLSPEDRAAVKTHIRKCGNVLFMQFATVIGTQSFTVANVQIPPTDLSVHALQVSCLAREVVKINGGTNMPLLLGGEFNLSENDASYQLLRDGYLSNDMIEELQRRKDIALPGKENESLVNLLWNLFQHPSSNLCSCYKSVLDHEFVIPETKKTSPDLLWFSSNSLHIVGVLDVVLDKPVDHNFSLKADVAFSV